MKTIKMLIGGILISFLVFSFGCNKSSSTAPVNSQLSGSGSDYFSLTGNQTIFAKATYQEVTYDSTGKIVETQAATNQAVKGYIGLAIVIAGMQGYPLYSYSEDGKTLIPTNVVVAQNNQSLIAFQRSDQVFTILPADLKVGAKWTLNPFSPLNEQVTLLLSDFKSSYINSAGKSYSNVIKVNAVYSDSVISPYNYSYYYSPQEWSSWHETEFSKITASVDFYFAKGIGLVDINVSQFDEINKWTDVDSNYYYYNNPPLQVYYYGGYSRTVASATCGTADSPSGNIAQKRMQNSLAEINIQKTPRKVTLGELLFGKHRAHQQGHDWRH